jgi:hypothetical protein
MGEPQKTVSDWNPPAESYTPRDKTTILNGVTPESWHCIDCDFDTSPGSLSRVDMEEAIKKLGSAWDLMGVGIPTTYDEKSEVYMVRDAIWKKAGIEEMGGCVCIACLEKRIGRRLKPKDFTDHPFNSLPGTPRLLDRRG